MNISPFKIAFDFDGVVADTFRAFVSIAKSEYGIDIEYEAITSYEILKIINIEKEVADKIIDTITLYPHELDLQPNKGVNDVLSRMVSMIHPQQPCPRPCIQTQQPVPSTSHQGGPYPGPPLKTHPTTTSSRGHFY